MKKKTTTFTELVVKGLMLFSIFTVLQGLEIFDSINRIWLVVVSVALLSRLITYRYTVKQFLVLLVTVVLHVIAVHYTDFPLYNTNMLFYFMLWVLLYLYFAKSKDKIMQVLSSSGGYITCLLWIWTLLVGVSAFIPSCYSDEGNFFSFAGTSFRLMPAALIVTALAMYMIVSRNDRRYYFFMLAPCYAALMNQSRTYFGVYVLFLTMFLYMRMKSRKKFYLMLIPFSVVVLMATLNGSIMDKFTEVWRTGVSVEEFLGAFTNARTIFWVWDLVAFFDLPVWQQFVGNGFDFAYEVTAQYGDAIWAHNDVISMLMNFGYIGTVIYTWAYFQLINAFWPKGSRVPRMVRFLFHSAVFLNSMMNMSYTYFCAVIAYPLFLCLTRVCYDETRRVRK